MKRKKMSRALVRKSNRNENNNNKSSYLKFRFILKIKDLIRFQGKYRITEEEQKIITRLYQILIYCRGPSYFPVAPPIFHPSPSSCSIKIQCIIFLYFF